MARSKALSSELHSQAYNLYLELESYRAVGEQLNVDHKTVMRWATGEVNCSCPWHNWDRLIAEKEVAEQRQRELIADGNFDPLAHEQALLDADPCRVSPPNVPAVDGGLENGGRKKTKATTRHDLERLSQFELIYTKLFYHITGVVLDHNLLLAICDGGDAAIAQHLSDHAKGLQPTNMEQCINAIIRVTNTINDLRERLGIDRKIPGASQLPVQTPVSTISSTPVGQIENKEKGPMTLQEMLAFKDRVMAMSEEDRANMTRQLNAEAPQIEFTGDSV